jgi:putative FmdB family regulatory protein
MPIYEFYCGDCHVVFNFLSKTVNTTKRPGCPRCGKADLERQISLFAVSRGLSERDADAAMPDVDEGQMEKAMEMLAREADGMSEDDPRAMARLMRKLYDSTGLRLGGGMEEAMRRMEAGDDPDKIEEEMGDLLEQDELMFVQGRGGLQHLGRRLRPPSVDDTLYEL